jgi:hypothetical protein
MATLKDEVKLFIVHSLACFDTPSQVAASVKQQFSLDVSLQQLQAYNPATRAGARISEKLKTIFNETRKKFLEDISDIPIAHQTFRLRVLNRMLEKVEKQGNVQAAAGIIEQAAKEVGGAFTNKQKLEHSGEIKTPSLIMNLNGANPTPKTD